jgi:ATP-binding cassette subfamily B protein
MIEALARRCRLFAGSVRNLTVPHDLDPNDDVSLGTWIDAAAARLGVEAEPVELLYAEVQQFVGRRGPLLIRLPGDAPVRFIALIGRHGKSVIIFGPDLAEHKLSPEVVRSALCQDFDDKMTPRVDQVLNAAGIPENVRDRVRTGILQETLRTARLDGVWMLRLSPGAGFLEQIFHAGVPQRMLGLIGAHTIQYLFFLLSWWIVGKAALEGHMERGWLLAWALLLLTLVPFRLLTTWLQGLVAIEVGAILKQRLLFGALRLEPEEVRHQGAGQLLGRVIESESVESLALSGGFLGLFALIELVFATAVLYAGAGGSLHVSLLFGWIGASVLLGWRYWRHRQRWTETRLNITHDLVERMVGHRTRIAQELRERWHEGEDQALEHYLQRSLAMDRTGVLLTALVPGSWLVVGLLGLAPAFASGRASPAELAVGLGGILLAYGALGKLVSGLRYFAGAAISWTQVAALFHAAARPEMPGSPSFALALPTDRNGTATGHEILEAHDVSFRYGDRVEPAFKNLNLTVRAGERLLLEGPSGGGKSTLVALLTGLRLPSTGLILLGGLDRQTLGSAGWRRRVVAAPQFHENHVLTETLAFNLLMGRRWPPRAADLDEAEAICNELGLGDLLKRMPSGLFQMVGETGWQLSHGERSRMYIARALLQRADLVIFDESFAALDPENLAKALGCVLDRAPTLMVVAHP